MFKSIFGSFFDFNNDGKLDLFEEFMEHQFINDVVMADDDNEDEDYSVFSDDDEEDSGESFGFSYDNDDDEEDELEAAGLDRFELSLMDEDERRKAFEDVGLDPDDYEVDFCDII